MLSFCYIYEQRNVRFPTRLDHWIFQDGWQITVSTDAGLKVILIQGLLTASTALT